MPSRPLAQNQAALEKAFEGREVVVLMDMPASHTGVDLYLQREPEIEFGEYARRMKAYGVALRKEDRVMITTIKVNKKNIEIHLGGGGYGTWGDDSGYVSPTYVGKSKRESDLEKERKNTTDPDRRRRIDRELGYLREEREREERANKREAEALTAIKQREVATEAPRRRLALQHLVRRQAAREVGADAGGADAVAGEAISTSAATATASRA